MMVVTDLTIVKCALAINKLLCRHVCGNSEKNYVLVGIAFSRFIKNLYCEIWYVGEISQIAFVFLGALRESVAENQPRCR